MDKNRAPNLDDELNQVQEQTILGEECQDEMTNELGSGPCSATKMPKYFRRGLEAENRRVTLDLAAKGSLYDGDPKPLDFYRNI